MGRTFYLDLEGGNDAGDGLSFATRWRTPTGGPAAGRIAPGDTIRIKASPAPVNTGFNATFTNGSADIAIPAGYVKTVCSCDAMWTLVESNSSIAADGGIVREGTASAKFLIRAASLVGRIAYYILPATLDLSAYNIISFLVRTSGLAMSGQFSLRLCSDTAGLTTVRSYTIRWLNTLTGTWATTQPANAFVPFAYDQGSSIGSGIKSIALYMDSDISTSADFNIWIDNVVALKNASVPTHKHLIGTVHSFGCGGNDNEPWYTIRSMTDTSIRIGYQANTLPNATGVPVYRGTTQTTALYIRDTLAPVGPNGDVAYLLFPTAADGAAESPITYSFGWDRTSMSTQTDATFLDLLSGVGYGMKLTNGYLNIERLGLVRTSYGLWASTGSHHCNIDLVGTYSNATHGTYCDGNSYHMLARTRVSGYNAACSIALYSPDSTAQCMLIESNGQSGIVLDQGGIVSGPGTVRYNTADGIYTNGPVYVENMSTLGNGNCGFHLNSRCNSQSRSLLRGCSFNETLDVYGTFLFEGYGQVLSLVNYDGNRDSWMTWADEAQWSMSPGPGHNPATTVRLCGTTSSHTLSSPAQLRYATLACKANRPVTVSLWVDRTDLASANTCCVRMLVAGQQIAGVEQDLVVEASGPYPTTNGGYELLTLSFTPAEDGSVDLILQVFATDPTTVSACFDDFSVNGAATLREMGLELYQQDGRPMVPGGVGNVIVIDE